MFVMGCWLLIFVDVCLMVMVMVFWMDEELWRFIIVGRGWCICLFGRGGWVYFRVRKLVVGSLYFWLIKCGMGFRVVWVEWCVGLVVGYLIIECFKWRIWCMNKVGFRWNWFFGGGLGWSWSLDVIFFGKSSWD